MSEKKSNGIFWFVLLLIGGGALFGISKAFGATKKPTKKPETTPKDGKDTPSPIPVTKDFDYKEFLQGKWLVDFAPTDGSAHIRESVTISGDDYIVNGGETRKLKNLSYEKATDNTIVTEGSYIITFTEIGANGNAFPETKLFPNPNANKKDLTSFELEGTSGDWYVRFKKVDSFPDVWHYEDLGGNGNNIPPASYLVDLLNRKIPLNYWEFYQAWLQGVYIIPFVKRWDASLVVDMSVWMEQPAYYYIMDKFGIFWFTAGNPSGGGYIISFGKLLPDNTILIETKNCYKDSVGGTNTEWNKIDGTSSLNSINLYDGDIYNYKGELTNRELTPTVTVNSITDLLNKGTALTRWQFYQAYFQGVYKMPVVSSQYYFDVTYDLDTGQYFINWNYYYPQKISVVSTRNKGTMGVLQSDNTWIIKDNGILSSPSFNCPFKTGDKFDKTGKKIN